MFCSFQCTDFTSFVKFISKYFTFYGIVNGIVLFLFQIVYGNITDFYMLILYPATLLNLLSFWVAPWGFSVYHLQVKTALLLPF